MSRGLGDVYKRQKDKIAKWQIPDAVVFVDELPLSSTGKPIKRDLRIRFRNYLTDEKNG